MKYLINYKTIAASVLLVFVFGCSSNNTVDENADNTSDHPDTSLTMDKVESYEDITYALPSPDEMIWLINKADISFHADLLNSVDKSKEYLTVELKAINLGIYSADLAYSVFFQKTKNAIKLYGVISTLKDEMHIATKNDKQLIERVKQNATDIDSLYEISNDAYYEIMHYLNYSGRDGTFAAIALGAFIESLYITVNSVPTYSADNDLLQIIADHKFTINNLFDITERFKEEPSIAKYQDEITELKNQFNAFGVVKIESKTTKNPDGSFIFDGGEEVTITEEQFNLLKVTLNKIRNEMSLN